MSYQHRTQEEMERAAFIEECARHEQDVIAKRDAAHNDEVCKLEEENLRLKEAISQLFEHYSPEHIDYVSGSKVGTNLKALTQPPQSPVKE